MSIGPAGRYSPIDDYHVVDPLNLDRPNSYSASTARELPTPPLTLTPAPLPTTPPFDRNAFLSDALGDQDDAPFDQTAPGEDGSGAEEPEDGWMPPPRHLTWPDSCSSAADSECESVSSIGDDEGALSGLELRELSTNLSLDLSFSPESSQDHSTVRHDDLPGDAAFSPGRRNNAFVVEVEEEVGTPINRSAYESPTDDDAGSDSSADEGTAYGGLRRNNAIYNRAADILSMLHAGSPAARDQSSGAEPQLMFESDSDSA